MGLAFKGTLHSLSSSSCRRLGKKGARGSCKAVSTSLPALRKSFLVQVASVALHRVSQAGQPDAQGGGKQPDPDWAQILEYWTRCARWHLCKYAPRVFVAKSHSVCARTSFQNSVERPVRLLATGSLLFDVAALSTGCPAASAIDDSLVLRGGRPLAGASDLRSGRV